MKDLYGRDITYLRLSVTELCNLRCRYCMPAEGIEKRAHDDMMSEEDMITAVRAAASLGIHKLRITGGEPLVKPNILSICEKSAAVEGIREVCLTTNGTLLPELAVPLREAGVHRINVSLDTMDPAKYAHMTRGGALADAVSGLEAALAAGFDKIKINAVLIGGFNDDEIPALADLTKRYPVDVRFIELMPMGGYGSFGASAYVPNETVLSMIPEAAPLSQDDGGVAKLYRLPGAQGNIGLISPLSDHFCGQCNRIRLTADGKFKPCLHSSDEYDAKGLDFDGMVEAIRTVVNAKPSCHPELSAARTSPAGRSMNRIGG
ncbi:MAG TPA: GTP 3',8-cyclase MoaA [Clostridiales bacterium]|nr:GTP 3',8-cyclase MoaA [Clostridiales bacterium]